MDYAKRRAQVAAQMEQNSVLVLYSGMAAHISADAYYPFEADRNFFYLTGLRRENMILLLHKTPADTQTILFIEQADPAAERWTGKMVTAEEAKAITGIADVRYVDGFDRLLNHLLTTTAVTTCYCECYRHTAQQLPGYNLAKAQALQAAYPGVTVRGLWPLVAALRMYKDADEVALLRKAVAITNEGLQNVLRTLRPGQKEYQAQAAFEYMIQMQGAEGPSFPTIAGSGKNGCMLHYETNQDTCAAGTLLLLDLGARYQGYCADITRTYPVGGKFTPRQRQVYEIVLRANRAVAAAAKPGMTTRELNDLCKQVLAEGCMELGLISAPEEIGKYYMHGVSHQLGIDVHDVTVDGLKLAPGSVISDEPGLYIDEWEIGIRIEDDLLITETGCEVLSAEILRTPDEIEAFMAAAKL